jgi:hypothetical protein
LRLCVELLSNTGVIRALQIRRFDGNLLPA